MIKHPTPIETEVTSASESDSELIEKLKASPFYQTYQNAFRTATGLPLILIPADRVVFNPCHASANQNPFCKSLNTGERPCSGCVLAQQYALDGAVHHANSVECFAGLKETAVPLRLGQRVVGYLKTGQVYTQKPSKSIFSTLRKSLQAEGKSEQEIEVLVSLCKQTPVLSKEQYSGMITLLSAFGLQLATLMNRILLETRVVEPEPVRKAKQYIMEQLDQRLTLETVASEVHVSTYYFCKIFKQSTGMTFTEYVNRQRIELAKRELLKPDRRITEVAYDVGYQSLSQFNRSFLKIVGESPSLFRKHMKSGDTTSLVA
ncbi:MAG: helix-turn-helix domain-containing protein [Verrucomicrobiales bacterium]